MFRGCQWLVTSDCVDYIHGSTPWNVRRVWFRCGVLKCIDPSEQLWSGSHAKIISGIRNLFGTSGKTILIGGGGWKSDLGRWGWGVDSIFENETKAQGRCWKFRVCEDEKILALFRIQQQWGTVTAFMFSCKRLGNLDWITLRSWRFRGILSPRVAGSLTLPTSRFINILGTTNSLNDAAWSTCAWGMIYDSSRPVRYRCYPTSGRSR